jgi:predicted nucleic-acid-binding Zn-ribbon protein
MSKVIRKLIVCPACGNRTFEVEGIELDGESERRRAGVQGTQAHAGRCG